MIRCSNPRCRRGPVRVLNSLAAILQDGTVVVARATECRPVPDGCGTTRVQREIRKVEDLGETGKRYVHAVALDGVEPFSSLGQEIKT